MHTNEVISRERGALVLVVGCATSAPIFGADVRVSAFLPTPWKRVGVEVQAAKGISIF